ncbi:MAG: PAS domain S-box protein [Verrucomicrobiota bacterium]
MKRKSHSSKAPIPEKSAPVLSPTVEEKLSALGSQTATQEQLATWSFGELVTTIQQLRSSQEALREKNEELVAAQQELAKLNDQARDLYEFAPVGYLTLDREGRILEANQTAAMMLRVTHTRLSRSNFSDFVTEKSSSAFTDHRTQVFEHRLRQTCELDMQRGDGNPLDARVQSIAFRDDPDRDPENCRTALIDITDEKEAEQWRLQAERLERMVEELPTAAVFVDQGETHLNRAAESLTGYERIEIKSVDDWFAKLFGEGASQSRARYEELRNRGFRDRSQQVAIRRKDGSERVVQFAHHRFEDQEIWLILDLTEHVTAEQGLKRTQFTIDRSREAIFWVNPDGSFRFANQAASKLSGYGSKQLLEMTVMDIALDLKTADWNSWWKHLRDAKSFQTETRFRSRNGKMFILELAVNYLEFRDEEFCCVFARDISERKEAERKLSGSEERMRQLAEHTTDVISLIQLNPPKFVYCSPAYERVFERPLEELYQDSKVWLDAVHPDDQERLVKIWESQHEKEFTVEYRVVRPNGNVRTVRGRGFPVSDEEGKPYRVAGVTEDITERKEAEIDQARLAALVESSPAGVIGLSLDGIIQQWNPAAEQLFGYEAREMIGQSIRVLAPAERQNELGVVVKAIREGKSVHAFETVRYHRDGTPINIVLTIAPILGSEGQPIGMNSIIQDNRERIQLQKEVTAAAEEEQERIAKELHDGHGSILSGLQMRIRGLQKRFENRELTAEAQEIEAISKELGDSITGLRNLIKGLHPLGSDPQQFVEAIRSLTARAKATNLMNCRFIPPKSPELVALPDAASANHLFRIAQEAMHNALRHSGGSQLTIQLKAEKEGEIGLTITDNGKGLAAEDHASHSGLGLKTMEYRAKLIGAQLTITRRTSGGTRVQCQLGE